MLITRAEIFRLIRCGEALFISYNRVGRSAVLLGAIANFRQALLHCDNKGLKAFRLSVLIGLGRSLVSKYHHVGILSILQEAIGYLEQALDATPIGHICHIKQQIDLADALVHVFDYTGTQGYIERALALLTAATSSTNHPLYPMAIAHLVRAEAMLTYDESLIHDRDKVVHLTGLLRATASHPSYESSKFAVLSGLAGITLQQHAVNFEPQLITDALSDAFAALRSSPLAPYEQYYIHRLISRIYYLGLFYHGNTDYKATGILHAKRALAFVPFNPIYRSFSLQDMSMLQLESSRGSQSQAELEKSFQSLEESLALMPSDHRRFVALQGALTNILGKHYEHTGRVSSLDKVIAFDGPELDISYPVLPYNVGLAMLERVRAFKEHQLVYLLDRSYQLLQMSYSALAPSSPHLLGDERPKCGHDGNHRNVSGARQ
jgi:tetratricopeptide (TPR) repeat protein